MSNPGAIVARNAPRSEVREREITNIPLGHEPQADVGRDSSRRGLVMRCHVGMNPDLRNPPRFIEGIFAISASLRELEITKIPFIKLCRTSPPTPPPALPLKGRELDSSPFKGEARWGVGGML